MQQVDVKQIARQVNRSWAEDGLAETVAGAYLALTGLLLVAESTLGALAALGVFALRPLMEALKRQWVYPRTGYVKAREVPGPVDLQGAALIGALVTAVVLMAALVVLLAIDVLEPANTTLRLVAGLLAGLLFAAGMVYAAYRTGMNRWWLYVAVSVTGGVAVPLVLSNTGVLEMIGVQLAALGAVIAVAGAVVFVRWLQTTPVAGDGDDGEG